MLVSARQLKWLLRFYPPLLFQRIWVVEIAPDFTRITIQISKSLLNTNYNRTIFGGTIFSAADVCYPVLLHQLLSSKNYHIAVWSRSAEIHFLKKITEKIKFSVNLSADDLQLAELNLNTVGKFTHTYPINIYNAKGEVCVSLNCEIYMRNLKFIKTSSDERLHE